MTSLNFKGKSAVWNHHLLVPFHTLDEDKKLSLKGDNADENLIIEGDNLLALKALLPKYQGKVKCIYIDPPNNTGNEGWVYNDKMNAPQIKDWYNTTVGKEGEDLTRHDKWLCMMTPRLKLLRELLSSDGVIFMSIDENEQHNLRSLASEIFGEVNHVATFVWAGRGGKGGTTTFVEANHEYVECYAKVIEEVDMKPVLTVQAEGNYHDETSSYRREQLRQWGQGDKREDRPSMWFAIKSPDNTDILPKREDGSDGRWRVNEGTYKKLFTEGNIDFVKNEQDRWVVYRKIRAGRESLTASTTLLLDKGTSAVGTREIKELFGDKVFNTTKPTLLVRYLIDLVTWDDKNAVILDSFAGSGTTAHAVMAQNKEDGGNRKFILVEMEEYANSITAERVRRAVKRDEHKAGFTYYKLGPAIDAETMLAGELPTYENFAKYVYYLATGKDHPDAKVINPKTYLVGKSEREGIYLVYEQDMDKLKSLAITLKWAQDTQAKDKGKKIVYAPACYLDEESLDQFNIQFVSIPYNLFERHDL